MRAARKKGRKLHTACLFFVEEYELYNQVKKCYGQGVNTKMFKKTKNTGSLKDKSRKLSKNDNRKYLKSCL